MPIVELLIWLSMPIVTISILFMLIRLIKGPTIEDRVVSLDLITTSGIALIAIYAVKTKNISVLDVGIIVGLIGFLGTVAFAYYLDKRLIKRKKDKDIYE